jgi:hypothetical protein
VFNPQTFQDNKTIGSMEQNATRGDELGREAQSWTGAAKRRQQVADSLIMAIFHSLLVKLVVCLPGVVACNRIIRQNIESTHEDYLSPL